MSFIEIDPLIQAAQAGGKILQDYFGAALTVVEKSIASDVQTLADLESERAILSVLEEYFPDYNIHSEEAGLLDKGSEITLIVDPLDGTNNFTLGIPNFAVSIGVATATELVAGVVYAPLIDQTFQAIKGKGAYQNGHPIHVDGEIVLERASLAHIQGYKVGHDPLGPYVKALHDQGLKRFLFNWSSAYDYCSLAAGKIEVITNVENELYDYSAGKLIAIEAGAKVTDLQGREEKSVLDSRFILSNGSGIHQVVAEIVSKIF